MGRRAEGWPRPNRDLLAEWATEWKLLGSLALFVAALCSFDGWLAVPAVAALLIAVNRNEVGQNYGD